MKILSEIISLIKISITSDGMESGGLLGMNSGIVCRFLFDKGTGSANEYIPNVSLFNQVLKEWAKERIEFAGIIHSHPNDCRFLSSNDEQAIKKIYQATESSLALYFPLLTFCNGEKIITSYKCENGKISSDEISVI